jgi:hypothetical protein
MVHVWQVRDGLLCELWEMYLDQDAEDRFWTGAVADQCIPLHAVGQLLRGDE